MAAIGASACDLTGDNSAILKTHAATRPGMAIWDAVGQADAIQLADVTYHVVGKDCSHPGFEVGRYNGLPFLKIIRADANRDEHITMRPYTEHGYATREELVGAVKTHVQLFANCKAIVFSFMRDQAWPSDDSFEVTVDHTGRIMSVGGVIANDQ